MRIENEEFHRIIKRYREQGIDRETLMEILSRITPGQAKDLFKKGIFTKKKIKPYLQQIYSNMPKKAMLSAVINDLKTIGFSDEEINSLEQIETTHEPGKHDPGDIKQVPEGSVVYLSEFKKELPRPIIVKTSNKHGRSDIEDNLASYEPVSLHDLLGQDYPSIAHVNLWDYYFIPMSNEVERAGGELRVDESTWHALKKTFYAFTSRLIADKEKEAWQIIVDETGPCNDYLYDSSFPPSVIMAVIIPPGETLPPAPFGIHSIDARFANDVQALRRHILYRDEIIIVALEYRSGAPAENLGPDVVSRDFHSQLWKNLLLFSLELILARTIRIKTVEVYSYFEQVSQLTPGLTSFFDTFVQDLAEKNEGRDGWGKIRIRRPVIVPKDTHPHLGYPDALGHVFRNTGEISPLDEQIKKRKNTILLDYHQEDFEVLYNIVTLFGKDQAAALKRIANTPYGHIRQLAPLCLAKPVTEAWEKLNPRDFESVCNDISTNISQRPECYLSCDFILKQAPEEFENRFHHTPLNFIFNMNRLAVCNHAGDVKKALDITRKLDPLSRVVNADLGFRYAVLKADILNNDFDFEGALKSIETVYSQATEQIGILDRALHVVGFKALTLALMGKSRQALEILNKYENKLSNIADRERWLIYKANIFIDQEKYQDAWNILNEVCKITGESMIEYAGKSKYYRQALMKALGRKAFLSREEIEKICRLPVSTEHPFTSILYWSIMALKNADLDYESLIETFYKALVSHVTVKTKALQYIAYSYYKKAVKDNLIDPDRVFEEFCADVKSGINALEDPLGLLHFNYL